MALSPSWCIMCKKEGEYVDHILLHCDFIKHIWAKMWDLFGVIGDVPYRWAEFIVIKWRFQQHGKKIKVLWRFLMMAVAWLVWLERNRRVFEERWNSIEELWCHARFLVGLWARASKIFDSTDQYLFCLDCDSCLG